MGSVAISEIGSKSLTGSYGNFINATLIARALLLARQIEYPSGGAFATSPTLIVVPPPGRFSTSTGWPRPFDMSCARSRPRKSTTPPGGYGTTSLIGRAGYVWDSTGPEANAATRLKTRIGRPRNMADLLSH